LLAWRKFETDEVWRGRTTAPRRHHRRRSRLGENGRRSSALFALPSSVNNSVGRRGARSGLSPRGPRPARPGRRHVSRSAPPSPPLSAPQAMAGLAHYRCLGLGGL